MAYIKREPEDISDRQVSTESQKTQPNKTIKFHKVLNVVCLDQQIIDNDKEIASFCYLLNRLILKKYGIRLPRQKPETMVYEADFDKVYRKRIIELVKARGNEILERLATSYFCSWFTEPLFDEIVENHLKFITPTEDGCSCVFTHVCFIVAILGVSFYLTGGISEAPDWAYNHMVKASGRYLSSENAVLMYIKKEQ